MVATWFNASYFHLSKRFLIAFLHLQKRDEESGPSETGGESKAASTSNASSGASSKDNDNAFPNEEEEGIQFPDENDQGDELEKGIKWKNLSVNTWFRIEDKKDVNSLYGPTNLLTLRDRDNTRYLVWATKLITESIDVKREEKHGGTMFIRSMGKKKSGTSAHSYYDFKYKILKQAI